MKNVPILALFASTVLCGFFSDQLYLRAQDYDPETAASNAREATRRAGAANAKAARALQEVKKLTEQPIEVPGETPDERAARQMAVRQEVDEAAAAAFAQKHPFLPAGQLPPIDPDVYARAARQSDERAFAEAKARPQVEQQRQEKETGDTIKVMQARIAQLEALSAANRTIPTAQPMPPHAQVNAQDPAPRPGFIMRRFDDGSCLVVDSKGVRTKFPNQPAAEAFVQAANTAAQAPSKTQ